MLEINRGKHMIDLRDLSEVRFWNEADECVMIDGQYIHDGVVDVKGYIEAHADEIRAQKVVEVEVDSEFYPICNFI